MQHLALKTDNIFETVAKVRTAQENLCGFELMTRPSGGYYKDLPNRLGDQLTVGLDDVVAIILCNLEKLWWVGDIFNSFSVFSVRPIVHLYLLLLA